MCKKARKELQFRSIISVGIYAVDIGVYYVLREAINYLMKYIEYRTRSD